MLSTALVKEIYRLLYEGELSHRKIALRLGVSRGTVASIASGCRALYGSEPSRGYSVPKLRPFRCPRCGYRVYFPCRICRMRRYRDSQMLLGLLARTNERLKEVSPRSKKLVRKEGQDCLRYKAGAQQRYFRAS